jgi:hypothetical protein
MADVEGTDEGHGYGVRGTSRRLNGSGVLGRSESGAGVKGETDSADGMFGMSKTGVGVRAQSNSHYGVYGHSNSLYGVYGSSTNSIGVLGFGATNIGVYGSCGSSSGLAGVFGESNSSIGVYGDSISNYGVFGHSESTVGVYAASDTGTAIYGQGRSSAAVLKGNVGIIGRLSKTAGSFKIDHPLDPANKYLYHSFVESPDMKNIYDGVVILDDKGEAEIELPDWFGALNKDFRYQLTAIGAPGPNLYIAEEISDMTTTTNYTSSSGSSNNNNNSHFKIAGGASGMKVSWQVTGIRRDPWANAHRIEVEEDKPDKERGYYLHPDLYGQPEEKGISHLLFPKEEKKKPQLLINENKPNL